ncbi:Regulator of chromosome condensation (RCC1) repeat protein [Candidatus Hepatoplasma crinochetorum Av]|uniref:Regulator of chromosome condensation (RCC1) repeat protein n=1 Tax=Candidatus Hepatoplasma crinochetorum Av TaxID=1427984 RepID=W8GJA0_9MOLU|nr:RCC1 domain-containing protein [Candidatus Hepatoplasma crinochetorum]AHK22322.1 Regulator of chromosome condensation (RCC1) repeat protein [Candidatus Hepatoplasma crinochetorum Av]
MKKFSILFLIPILLLGIKTPKLKELNDIEISQNDTIISLSLNSYHSGITVNTNNDGYADTLYMWGDNSFGQLGDGTTEDSLVPIKIIPQGQADWSGNLIDLSLGDSHSGVTVDTDLDGYADTLYIWGSDKFGQIGNGSISNNILIPIKITPQGQTDWSGNLIDLSLGDYNSGVTVDTDLDGYADTLYMWGLNNSGQIGNGSSGNNISIPTKITPQGQTDWGGNLIDLSLGYNHTGVTVDTDLDGFGDTLYMWGDNTYGQIGNGSNGNNILIPTKIAPQGQTDWGGYLIDLSLGNTNTGILIDSDFDQNADTLYIWGDNLYGQIGDGTTKDSLVPKKITPQGQTDWGGNLIDLALGPSTRSAGVLVDVNNDQNADTLYMWGDNSSGQLGDGTTKVSSIPKKITPQGQTDWSGNLIDLSLGSSHSGVIVDIDFDGYADTLYMWGYNAFGQLGDGTTISESYPKLIISSSPFFIKNLDFFSYNNKIEFNLEIDDYQNIINEAPEVILTDQNDIQYQTTFIADKSNIDNDQYYYQVNNTLYGDSYNFTEILINDNSFNIEQNQILTDYLISNYSFISSTEEEAILSLDLSQNSDNFNLDNYTNEQKQINVNYTNLDNNINNSQQFILDQTNQIKLINLNAETNYQIDSIQYFYEDGNYKYTIDQEAMQFQTIPANPIILADSILIIENSITANSFQYTIEINNLKINETKDNFTQYDINNGIWLIDENGESYNSSFIDAKLITNGEINGTQNYQLTFLQENLISGQTYNFTGIGFNDPNGSNPDTVNFSNLIIVETTLVNKAFVDNSFLIDQNSITTNSFQYTIEIDNLILSNDLEEEPIFSNFDLNGILYLKDQNNNIYSSYYISNSALNLGIGEEEGTFKYQFRFEVNNLEPNTNYNFISLSFTDNFDDTSLDISENGQIITDSNASAKIIIYTIIIILILIILLTIILLFIDLKMKNKTKRMAEALDNPDNYNN